MTITHRRIFNIAWPVVLSNATVPLLGVVDTAVVGQIGLPQPIGAVGIGAIIISAIFWMFGFLRMGTTGLTAQALGAGDYPETRALLVRSLLIAAIAGFVIIVLQWPLIQAALWIAPSSNEVETLAKNYLQIRFFGAPAAIAIYGITGWLIAQERTSEVLILQVWLNGANILLDVWFVLGLGWGVNGVAIATVISEFSALIIGLWMTCKVFQNSDWKDKKHIFDRVKLANMLRVNLDILIRSALLQVGFVSFLFIGSSFDDVTLAANQVLLQFLYVTAYAMDGFAFAVEALVGQAIGSKNRSLFREAAIKSSQWGFATVLVLSLVFAVFGNEFTEIIAKSTEVQSRSNEFIFWIVLAPLLGFASWMLDGIFIGATRTKDMRNMMALSILIYGISLIFLIPLFENHGLWAALIIMFVVRAITLGLCYPNLERSI